jgi:hypothetical protein
MLSRPASGSPSAVSSAISPSLRPGGAPIDIPASRYQDALAAGAVPVGSKELVARLTAAGLRVRKATLRGG